MSHYLDPLYINFLGSQLDQFKSKSRNLWEFRCPLCLDSSKSKTKKRGYIYEKKGQFFFFCHNCSASHRFDKFLKLLNPHLYNQYRLEKLSKTNPEQQNEPTKRKDIDYAPKHKDTIDLVSIADLDDSHFAKIYVKNRMIPEDKWYLLYFADDFREFTDSFVPGKYKIKQEPRLVLPFWNEQGKLTGFQGRALVQSEMRYVTVRIDDESSMFYGCERINKKRTIFVVEGPIDSLFLENCIAMCGSHNSDVPYKNCVYILDCERRNKHITQKIEGLINEGKRVLIWNEHFEQFGKDINEMVLNGLNVEEIENYIQHNSLSGLRAKLKLAEWKR